MESRIVAERRTFGDRFSPQDYLSTYFLTPGTAENTLFNFTMKNVHHVLEQMKSPQVKIRFLDYGCGPVVCHAISAAGIPNMSEIVLAEYTARNRETIKQWLDKDPSSFNWSPYFKHVVQTLEGKTEQEVVEREEKMRSLVKVVPCDITQDPPIEKGYVGPYDIVLSSLCLETMCVDIEEYCSRVSKLSILIKPGGSLLLVSTNREPVGQYGSYSMGSECFYDLNVSYKLVAQAIEMSGLNILTVNHLDHIQPYPSSDSNGYMFVCANKKL